MDKSKSPSLSGLLLTALFLIVAIVYGIITLSTQDPLWFVSSFNEYPESIDLYCYTAATTLRPEDDQFDELVEVINSTLSGRKTFDPLTMSDETYEYYRTSGDVVVLEVIFTQKVRIHSFYTFFSNLDSIVIPLVGRHSNVHALFGRSNGMGTGGSLRFEDMAQVTAFVQESGLCPAR